MVRFAEGKLIIEIDTFSPMDDLGKYRMALVDVLTMVQGSGADEAALSTVQQLGFLLRELEFSDAQLAFLDQFLTGGKPNQKTFEEAFKAAA